MITAIVYQLPTVYYCSLTFQDTRVLIRLEGCGVYSCKQGHCLRELRYSMNQRVQRQYIAIINLARQL